MNYTDNEFSFNLVSCCDIKTHTKSVTEKSTDGPERDVKKEEDYVGDSGFVPLTLYSSYLWTPVKVKHEIKFLFPSLSSMFFICPFCLCY